MFETCHALHPVPASLWRRVCAASVLLGWLASTAHAAGMAVDAAPAPAAGSLRIATWNLGWHQTQAEAQRWATACSAPFAKGADGLWAPAAHGDKTGWTLRWGRDAKVAWDLRVMPPCDVYQARFKPVPVTAAAYAKRVEQVRRVIARPDFNADVIAFQEVSGADAVREVLPNQGADYLVCSYSGYSVQRLAFAWRRSLGGSPADCAVEPALSLPGRPDKERPRPGLALTLKLQGQRVHFLNVHLKSSCVSPLESTEPDGKGQLAGRHPACAILQAQLPALETWLEQSARTGPVVLLGDFNRNLGHEQALRTAGPQSLLAEVNDGSPANSRLTWLPAACQLSEAADSTLQPLCERAHREVLDRATLSTLGAPRALGCRNPVGLDHILASPSLKPSQAYKLSLGPYGQTKAANAQHPDPLLAVSDHCPLIAQLNP